MLDCHFHFEKLDELVESEIFNCHDCQMFTNKATQTPLIPVYVPLEAWEFVSMDFFGPMPNKEYILVIQDMCTKYPVAVVMKNTNAEKTIEALDEVFTNFGRPTKYRSDNGPPFNADELDNYMKVIGLHLTKTTFVLYNFEKGLGLHNRN